MKRQFGCAARGIVTALFFGRAAPAMAADHRDAPGVDDDISTDITDVYMFRNPADASKLVVTFNTHPLSEPKFAPSYHYNSKAVYRFLFHTNTTAVPTSQIDFTFTPFTVDSSGKGSQNFTAYFPHGIILQGPVTFGTVNTSTPATPLVTQGPRGTKIFAGPRQDPFVFDFVGFNRFLAGITPNFTGNDSFAGVNVMAIVVEMPLSMVVGNAQKFGFWGATFLQEDSPTQLTQIDRMGNPAINTALIPSFMKDAFNVGKPQNDATDFAPTILKTLAGFNTPPANVQILASVAVPDTLKFDVTKPDGFPNGRRLQDRVIDTELQLITGNPAVTDGTAAKQAAKVYLSTFPYLGPPCQASTLGVNAPGDCSPGSNVNPAAKPQPAVP